MRLNSGIDRDNDSDSDSDSDSDKKDIMWKSWGKMIFFLDKSIR